VTGHHAQAVHPAEPAERPVRGDLQRAGCRLRDAVAPGQTEERAQATDRRRLPEERVDEDGEMSLPVDEQLDDLEDVELASGADSPEEEVEEEVGPVADAADLADLEIED